jgi:N-acetyl-anhydromuramyl-L-alanine amidase AmpD
MHVLRVIVLSWIILAPLVSCRTTKPNRELTRQGDEIIIAGRFFHTGAPVVLWLDQGGFDAYRVERRFARPEDATWETAHKSGIESPNRSGPRKFGDPPSASPADGERTGDWSLEDLRRNVHQLIIHYDAAGTSRSCFRVLHDVRGLSCHFLIDLDGTIYQTLDVKERAWHAAQANDRSVGIELANIGAYAPGEADAVLERWYTRDEHGFMLRGDRLRELPVRQRRITMSRAWPMTALARSHRIEGEIQGRNLVQHDFTRGQYDSLARLAACLHSVLPRIELDAPRGATGSVDSHLLDETRQSQFCGVLGHYHLSASKIDPGPAFQWDRFLEEARRRAREYGTWRDHGVGLTHALH